MKKFVLAVMVVALFAMTGAAFAQATANFDVQANVLKSCRFVDSPSTLSFGNYDPTLVGDIDSETSFSYRCTRNTDYRVYIVRNNQMLVGGPGGTDPLDYALYTDSTRTNPFPLTYAGATPQTSTNNSPVPVTIYGRVFDEQNVLAGLHTDNAVIHIEY